MVTATLRPRTRISSGSSIASDSFRALEDPSPFRRKTLTTVTAGFDSADVSSGARCRGREEDLLTLLAFMCISLFWVSPAGEGTNQDFGHLD